jgi:hypothetical protein
MFLFTRENRTDKCTACSSFQQTIQTLRDVYENTLTQKDNHIRYLGENCVEYSFIVKLSFEGIPGFSI